MKHVLAWLYILSQRKDWEFPKVVREAFEMLYRERLIEESLRDRLIGMVGFRNIAVHNYQEIELKIIQRIIETHLKDLEEFTTIILRLS